MKKKKSHGAPDKGKVTIIIGLGISLYEKILALSYIRKWREMKKTLLVYLGVLISVI